MLNRALLTKLLRFGVVGIIVMVAFMGMNAGFSRFLGLGKMAAFFAAYPPALCLHFLLNKRWTFESKAAASRKQVGEYLVMVGTTLVIQWVVFAAVTAHWPLLPGWVGAGAANAAQMAVSFLVMQRRVFAAQQPEGSAGAPNGGLGVPLWVCTIAIVAGSIAFYGWSLSPVLGSFASTARSPAYYPALVRGFLSGHLYMDVPLPAHIASAKNGVLPEGVPYLLDASFYEGRYYLYFGAAPAFLLFLPFRLLTGLDLSQKLAIVIFCGVGLVFLTASAAQLRARWFPKSSAEAWLGAVILLGFGTMVPAVVRRGECYEVAATAAFCFWAGLLWCLVRASMGQTPLRWLALGSCFAGLAVASRPELILGSVLVVAFSAIWLWRSEGPGRTQGRALRLAMAAALPLAFIGLCVAAYNAARFGNPLEFGHTYQVGSNQEGFASMRYFWHNLRIYYLVPPLWSWYFPFVSPAVEGVRPQGYFGIEHAHGEWIFLPFFLSVVVPATALALRRRRLSGFAMVFGILALWFIGNLVFLCCIGVRSNRYMLGFHPALAFGSALAVIALGEMRGLRGACLRFVGIAWVLAALVFNLGASFETQRFFRDFYPNSFDRLSTITNRVAWPIQARFGSPPGAQRVEVTFPKGMPGKYEVLLATGTTNFADGVLLVYDSESSGHFVLYHSNLGSIDGDTFAFVPGRRYTMDLSLGMLFPPPGHPWYGSLPESAQRWLKGRNTISLDQVCVFSADAPSIDGELRPSELVRGPRLPSPWPFFSGSMAWVKSLPVDMELVERHHRQNGAVTLRILLPRSKDGLREPLLTLGNHRDFNIVTIRYVDSGHVIIGLDGAGAGVAESAPIAVDYGSQHTVEVYLDSLLRDPDIEMHDSFGRVMIYLDGRQVLGLRQHLARFENDEVMVGARSWFGNSTRMTFSGRILAFERKGALRSEIADAIRTRGIVDIGLRFPTGITGTTEPIMSRGSTVDGECLFVTYRSDHSVVLGFDRRGFGAVYSNPIEVDYQKVHMLGISYGELLAQGSLGREKLRVSLDGHEAIDAPVSFVQGRNSPLRVGRNTVQSSVCTPEFHGIFTSIALRELSDPARVVALGSAIELTLQLPQKRLGFSEPVIESGVAGAADSLYLVYEAAGRVRFGLDRWGLDSRVSEPVSVDYSKPVRVRIDYGPLFPKSDPRSKRILVVCNGATVMDEAVDFHDSTPEQRIIGANPLGMSTSQPEFSGQILQVEAVR